MTYTKLLISLFIFSLGQGIFAASAAAHPELCICSSCLAVEIEEYPFLELEASPHPVLCICEACFYSAPLVDPSTASESSSRGRKRKALNLDREETSDDLASNESSELPKKKTRTGKKTTWHNCDQPECNYKTNKKSHLKRHKTGKHNIGVVRNSCDIGDCPFKTKQKSHLKEHKANIHNIGVTWHYCDLSLREPCVGFIHWRKVTD